MGTSAGPNLAGIGRGGDSNLVLEMDAHDAKSYPGEPTSNILSNPNNWTGSDWTQTNGTVANNAAEGPNGGSAGSITATNADPYIYSNLVHSVATGGLTFSCWVKGVGSSVGKSGDIRINFNGTATGSATTVGYTLTGLWQRVSISGTVTGAGTIKVGLEPPNSAAVGDVVYLADAQLEQKGYATPFVREGNGGTGTYNARPASINLMIHGNVGSGQTFSDSSPSKHTITAGGDVTHSGGQSKFSGGSIYFDSDGDYLSIPDSADWDFGNEDFTIDFWLGSPTDTGLWAEVIGQGWTSGSDSWVIGIDWQNNNKMRLAYTTNGSADIYGAWTSVISTSGWTHYAFVRSGTTLTNYVNGVADGTHTIGTSTIYSSNKPLYIGQRQTSVGSFDYVGYMDEVRITKGTALWTSDFTPPTRRNLSAPVVDRSGNDNGGNFATKETTDVATYRDGEVIRPIDSAVWDFDGTDDQIRIGSSSSYNNTLDKTVAMWINAGSGVGGLFSVIYTNRLGNDSEVNLSLYLDDRKVVRTWNPSGTDEMVLTYSVGNGTNNFFTWSKEKLGTTTGDNLWHYVVGVTDVSQNKIFLYYDGYNVHSTTISGTIDTPSADLRLGSGYGPTDSTSPFTGKISAFRVYNKRLTDQQIKENFNQQRSRFNVPNWSNRDIVQSGLIRWLDFGEAACYSGGAIGTVNDLKTGTAYTASNSGGGITYSGDGGGCFAFAGTTDDKIPFTATANLPACTVSVWVYNLSGGDTRQTLFGHYFEIASERLQMYSYGFSNLGWRFSTSGSVPYNTWTNAVMTWDGSNVKAYINGALNYTNTVGAGGTAGGFYEISVNWARLKAKLATGLIYDRALSASELEQNFTVQRQRFGI